MGSGGKIICWHKGIASELACNGDSASDENLETPRSPRFHHSDLRSQRTHDESTRKLESLTKLVARRENDQNHIRERCDRIRITRGQRFDRLLERVQSEDELKYRVTNVLREHQEQKDQKKSQKYHEWNDVVFGRIQRQIDAYLNPADRLTEQKLTGSKTVGFRIPGDTFRPTVGDSDPLKRSLTSTAEEVTFRKSFTDMSCQSPDKTSGPIKDLARSRPMLEPELWEQLKLQATPYGHFAQVTEDGGCLKTSLRTRGFVPDESDSIPTAGTRRTRWEHNNLGILADGAVRGEASKHYTAEGGSSGAPTQDHYRFERGTKVTDTEFPLGKRMFPRKH